MLREQYRWEGGGGGQARCNNSRWTAKTSNLGAFSAQKYVELSTICCKRQFFFAWYYWLGGATKSNPLWARAFAAFSIFALSSITKDIMFMYRETGPYFFLDKKAPYSNSQKKLKLLLPRMEMDIVSWKTDTSSTRASRRLIQRSSNLWRPMPPSRTCRQSISTGGRDLSPPKMVIQTVFWLQLTDSATSTVEFELLRNITGGWEGGQGQCNNTGGVTKMTCYAQHVLCASN